MYSSHPTTHILDWYRRSLTLRRRSSVIAPLHPAFWIALSTASSLSQPCSGMTSGRYVALNVWRELTRGRGRYVDDDSGDGAPDSELDASSAGCANVSEMPCTPTVQSRYDAASSKSVRSETLCSGQRRAHGEDGRTGRGLRALEPRELAPLDLAEAVVAERADEGILLQAVVQRQRLEAADAAAQARGAARARRTRVPRYEERAAAPLCDCRGYDMLADTHYLSSAKRGAIGSAPELSAQ